MFQQRIQLPREETRSRWSIPCCSSFRTRGIQLPDDSDHEEEQDIAPFHIESTHFLQHPSNLSRNPFARAELPVSPLSPPTPKIVLPTQEEPIEVIEREISSRQKYENEPDWTELHQADTAAAEAATKADAEVDVDADTAIVVAGAPDMTEPSLVEQEPTESMTVTEEEEEEEIPKKEEKIPQIEREVLHLLPLPQLSNELPPAMIHKKPSFEKSMYGEQPLMSTHRSANTSRFSRFSMTEQDFLALKKQEADAVAMTTPTATATGVTDQLINNDPVTTITDPLQSPVTQDRKSSIVSNAAHSILGDKLDDFTEKLAFIKKNIIMNQDSDDEEEADNAQETLRKMALLKQDSSTVPSDMPPAGSRTLHRRTSSLMDVAPTLARFMNQISEDTSFSPSSLFSALAGPEPHSSVPNLPEDEEQQEEEELFDFTKVIEIGKNMRSFSEGFVGNGMRILNDVATRIKTTADEEKELKEDDEGNWINDSYI